MFGTVVFLQAVERQIEVIAAQVEDIKSNVKQAVRVWALEELNRPYNHIKFKLSEVQQSVAVRYNKTVYNL